MSTNIANPNNAPPNAPDEPNLQPGITATTITVTVVADIIVILRIITRKWIVKTVGLDDWCIIAAAVSSLTLAAFSMCAHNFDS
jgi:hypothetical protein